MLTLTRRNLLQALIAGPVLAWMPNIGLAQNQALVLSARDSSDGKHWAVAFGVDGQEIFSTLTAQRCHDILPHPNEARALFIARRPGTECYWINTSSGQILSVLIARSQRHFYGHGVFDPSAALLYLTENDLTDPGRGVIGIYQRTGEKFEFLREISTHGVEPHQLAWMPGHAALVTANGGMRTEAGSRTVINSEKIESSLVIVDTNGKLISSDKIQTKTNADAFTSIRHLAVASSGTIYTAQQFFPPNSDNEEDYDCSHLLLAQKAKGGVLTSVPVEHDTSRQLNRYLASIELHPSLPLMAITAPRGDRVLVWNTQTLTCISNINIGDCAGIVAWEQGFIVSSGQGRCRLLTYDAGHISLRTLALPAGGWDNHLRIIQS